MFGLVIGLIAAEILAGYFFYPVSSVLFYRIPDPVLGWRLKPNIQFTKADEGHIFQRVKFNSHGWRDKEHDYAKPAGVVRIVVLGDSYMEGSSVEFENIFSSQLAHILKERGKSNVEVINLGVSGYGTLQEYYVLKNEGVRYHPDLVLLGFFFGNDLSDNSSDLKKERVGERTTNYTNRPYLLPGPENEWKVKPVNYQQIKANYDERVHKFEQVPFWQKSHLYRVFHPLLPEWEAEVNSRNRAHSRHSMDAHFCNEDDTYKSAWIITRRILTRVKQEASYAHSELVVFTVPFLYEADPLRIQKDEILRNQINDLCLDPPIGYDRLKAILNQLQIQWIDLLPVFRNVAPKQELYLPDLHWNEKGHRLAALQVAQFLVTQRLL